MSKRWARREIGLLLAIAAIAAATQGCGYFRHRLDDSKEMFDVGFTFSKKPQFAAYTNCPIIFPIGYGKVDGHFVGVGGGKAGVMKHQESSSGLLLWGREEVTWEKFDETAPSGPQIEDGGLLGLATAKEEHRIRTPACKHYLHLGWVGLVGNVRWLEIPDFLLGWFLLDPSRDDGEDGGWWFWGRRRPSEAADDKTPDSVRVPAQARKPASASRPRTEFCLVCGGRRFVNRPAPVAGAVEQAPEMATDPKAWPGRWCTCTAKR